MTKEQLKNYRHLIKEIAKTDKDIDRLLKRQARLAVVKDKVQASMKDYPYAETHVTVEAREPLSNSTIEKLLIRKRAVYRHLQTERLEIEDFIQGIEDSRTRQIFDLIFIKGKSQQEVSMIVNLEQSWISRIISKTLDN